MMIELNFNEVHARVLATRSMQEQLQGDWTWTEATVADWNASVTALTTARDAYADSLAAEGNARIDLKASAASLHAENKLTLGIAKTDFRNAPAKLGGFAGLQAVGASIPKTLATAQSISSAWQKADPAWTPVPGKTLAAYDALRSAVAGKQSALSSATAAVRQSNRALRARLTTEDKKAKAWYAVATRVFPVGTPHGDALRAAIRTA